MKTIFFYILIFDIFYANDTNYFLPIYNNAERTRKPFIHYYVATSIVDDEDVSVHEIVEMICVQLHEEACILHIIACILTVIFTECTVGVPVK